MELRTHHLLCIPMYQGHGYSEAFCEHMAKVIETIKETEEAIRPLASPDVVCTRCPHLQPPAPEEESSRREKPESELLFLRNRYCDREKQISRKDSRLLESLGLCCGREYGREELKRTVLSHMTEEIFNASCGKCEWLQQGLCSFSMWKVNFKKYF
ncbi:MAG: DUF1284 domain-containing protein [Lachnospiraceae bacterium]|nr:DUF1284 domain-containing protein [Lachnospiraceae bacterium]